MLSIQVASLLLTFLILRGNAVDGNEVTGCSNRCSEMGGECVTPRDECTGQVISAIKCADGTTCNCCTYFKENGTIKKREASSDNSNGDANKTKKDKTKNTKMRQQKKKTITEKPRSGNKFGPKTQNRSGNKFGPKNGNRNINPGSKKTGNKENIKEKGNKKSKPKKKENGSGKTGRRGKKGKKPKKNEKGSGKTGRKGKKAKKPKKKELGSGKTGRKGPKKKKGSKGNKEKNPSKNKDDHKNNCDFTCMNGKCGKNDLRCDKFDDCGDNTDELNCNFASKISCHRCKTWDTGDVGAKYDPSCGNTGYTGHADKADTLDPFIGCAIKVYKNGDVIRLFESWQYNATQGNCYAGSDHDSDDPEYQYTRCWCAGDNCNTGLCEECEKQKKK